ncbi:MAG TPA: hypothetical protein VGO50_09965 [Pyrinomonadaceae bacterium]|jgi:hypothetical protein|nr:hypothetical protein [Pyrinomonadaceae bacterium]
METPTFLYKPNFCAECGERIDRENWHFWSSRRFCENCEPVYRMNRIFPPALAGIVLFFGGIFFSQMGQKYEKPNPVMTTQAALAVEKGEKGEKPAPAAIKQVFAANTEPGNSPVVQTPAANSNTPKQMTANLAPQQMPAAVHICGARTQKGTPCSRRVRATGMRCWQHPGKPSMLERLY